jgi:putative transposase
MKGTRHSEEQIIAILKQGEAGLSTAELCRQQGITEQTYYRWKAKYGGLESGDARKLKQLEDENRKLKHVVAELRAWTSLLWHLRVTHFSQADSVGSHLAVQSVEP